MMGVIAETYQRTDITQVLLSAAVIRLLTVKRLQITGQAGPILFLTQQYPMDLIQVDIPVRYTKAAQVI